jgi:acyl-CoA reductase-like NAD-dependent aldehyde dehydrogenase
MTYQSVNPANGKILKTFKVLTDKQLESKLATAATCFKTWKHTSYEERAVIVARAAALMKAHVDEFAKLATLEMGKRIDEARGEVTFSGNIDTGMMFINNIDWAAAELPCGGMKNSGYGRELGDMGIQQFVNKKLVRTVSMDAPV